jgi:hypothetical protein
VIWCPPRSPEPQHEEQLMSSELTATKLADQSSTDILLMVAGIDVGARGGRGVSW